MNINSEAVIKSLEHDFITFQKLVKLALDLIEEIESGNNITNRGEVHIIYAAELFVDLESILPENINNFYDGVEDIPGFVFILLQTYLKLEFVSDDITDVSDEFTQRAIVFNAYQRLGDLIGREVEETLRDTFGIKLLTDNRPFAEKYSNILSAIFGILENEVGGIPFHGNDPQSRKFLEDFLYILEDAGIISDDELTIMISEASIHEAIYNIIKERLIGIHIPEDSDTCIWFRRLTSLYGKFKIDGLKKSVSDEVVESIRFQESGELVRLILDEYEGVSSDNQSWMSIGELLYGAGIITKRQNSLLQISDSRDTFLIYLTHLLKNNGIFLTLLSPHAEAHIETHFHEYVYTNGGFGYDFRLGNRTKNLKKIESCADDLIYWLLNDLDLHLSHEYLAELIGLLESTIGYQSSYLRLLRIHYDEIAELPIPFNKAIQVLGIIIFDVIDRSHPLFDKASQLLLKNTSSIKKRAAILNYISENEVEKKTYRSLDKQEPHVGEKVVVSKSQKLYYWMKEIIHILKSGSLEDEGEYLSQFYAFLYNERFFDSEELQDFIGITSSTEIILEIIERIFTRHHLQNFGNSELELLDTFLLILEHTGEQDRYERLMDVFFK